MGRTGPCGQEVTLWVYFNLPHGWQEQARKVKRNPVRASSFWHLPSWGLIALLGLALDLGLLVCTANSLKRAVDAATLAGVVELPDEEQAMSRAIEYLRLNGYDVGTDVDIQVMGCARDSATADLVRRESIPVLTTTSPPQTPKASFLLDTYTFETLPRQSGNCQYHSSDSTGTADKFAITGTVTVSMSFMRFFGFDEVPTQEWPSRQNITNLDVVGCLRQFRLDGRRYHLLQMLG